MTKYVSTVVAAAAAALAAGCSSSGGYGDGAGPPPAANSAPRIDGLADQTVDQDTAASVVFSVADGETAAKDLVVTATPSDTTIVRADAVAVAGGDASRTLMLTPREDATGAVSVSVSVRDAQGAVTTRPVVVTFRAVNASMLETTLAAYALAGEEMPLPVSGRTYTQDADDPVVFDGLLAP